MSLCSVPSDEEGHIQTRRLFQGETLFLLLHLPLLPAPLYPHSLCVTLTRLREKAGNMLTLVYSLVHVSLSTSSSCVLVHVLSYTVGLLCLQHLFGQARVVGLQFVFM